MRKVVLALPFALAISTIASPAPAQQVVGVPSMAVVGGADGRPCGFVFMNGQWYGENISTFSFPYDWSVIVGAVSGGKHLRILVTSGGSVSCNGIEGDLGAAYPIFNGPMIINP